MENKNIKKYLKPILKIIMLSDDDVLSASTPEEDPFMDDPYGT